MKIKLNLIVILGAIFFSHLLFAETHNVLLHLEASECVHIDGRKDCSKSTLPDEELMFKLVQSSSGKYFAFKEVQTYINNEVYKSSFYLSTNSLRNSELKLRVELSSPSNSGNTVTKVKQFKVKSLSKLNNIKIYGEPVITNTGPYMTEVKYGIKFIN